MEFQPGDEQFKPRDETGANQSASEAALLVSALDQLAARLHSEAEETLCEEAYDERDYHALAQGFHAARRDMLDAERSLAVVHPFHSARGAEARAIAARRTAGNWSLWVAGIAMAAGLALLAWSAFGNRAAAVPTGGADAYEAGHVRGAGTQLELRIERRDDQTLHFAWTGEALQPNARYTLRIYPAGSLRAVITAEHLELSSADIAADQLEVGTAYEAEVELEAALASGVMIASARLPFQRESR